MKEHETKAAIIDEIKRELHRNKEENNKIKEESKELKVKQRENKSLTAALEAQLQAARQETTKEDSERKVKCTEEKWKAIRSQILRRRTKKS